MVGAMQLCVQQCCHCRAAQLQATPFLPKRPRQPTRHHGALPTARRRTVLKPQAFAGAAAPALSTGAGLTLSTGIVSFFSFAVGSLGLAILLADQFKQPGADPECTTCEGTGLVSCVCNRWSDGDRGCSICGGTGRMSCPSCGGGGTAVPIAARAQVIKTPSSQSSCGQPSSYSVMNTSTKYLKPRVPKHGPLQAVGNLLEDPGPLPAIRYRYIYVMPTHHRDDSSQP